MNVEQVQGITEICIRGISEMVPNRHFQTRLAAGIAPTLHDAIHTAPDANPATCPSLRTLAGLVVMEMGLTFDEDARDQLGAFVQAENINLGNFPIFASRPVFQLCIFLQRMNRSQYIVDGLIHVRADVLEVRLEGTTFMIPYSQLSIMPHMHWPRIMGRAMVAVRRFSVRLYMSAQNREELIDGIHTMSGIRIDENAPLAIVPTWFAENRARYTFYIIDGLIYCYITSIG